MPSRQALFCAKQKSCIRTILTFSLFNGYIFSMYTCITSRRHDHGRFRNSLSMLFLALFFFLAAPVAGSAQDTGSHSPLTLSSEPLLAIEDSPFSVLPQRSLAFLPADSGTLPFPVVPQDSKNATMNVAENWPFPVSALTGNRTSFPSDSIQTHASISGKGLRAIKSGEKRFHTSGSAFCIRSADSVLPQRSIRPVVMVLETPPCLLPSARGLVVFSLPPPHSC